MKSKSMLKVKVLMAKQFTDDEKIILAGIDTGYSISDCYSFAFVLTPCPVEGDSFESFKSQFLRRLTISNQCCFTRDETIYRETIVQQLTDLGSIPIPGFWVIQHDHHRRHAAPFLPGALEFKGIREGAIHSFLRMIIPASR